MRAFAAATCFGVSARAFGLADVGGALFGAPSVDLCGDGLGDLRATDGPIEACRRCHGGQGMLTFNDGFADGLGYSSCGPLVMQQPSSEHCGEGLGDLRATEGPIEACRRCHGGKGMLTFNDGFADGLGYSSCGPVHTGRPEMKQPSSESCGEGLGDLRTTEGPIEACGRCHGGTGMLTFNDGFADGLGYSSCGLPVMQPSSEQCGEGLGDLSATEGSLEACGRCHGGKGMLTFNDGFADGLGYSSCGPLVMQQPSSEHCGEGLGDLRETPIHQEGLPAPWSETSSDTQMLATQQQQPMILWTLLVGVSGFFLLRQCTAIPEPEVRAAPLHRPVLLRSGQNFLSARKGG